jgi:TolB-like protein/Tfp pilus assembly protein PilF
MAFESAQKAIEMDDTSDISHTLLSAVYLVKRQHEKAVAEAERAVALNPNGALAYNTLAGVVGCLGRWEESIIYGKKSIRQDPIPLLTSFHWLGRAYFMTGQYDDAILTFKKLLDRNPNYLPAHAFLAASYSSLGREVEATAAVKEVLRVNPEFSLESYAKTLPYKNNADAERYIGTLRKAGLPDKPPMPLPNKPSIAVLAFDNMTGDPQQEYLSDGISENIISALSKVSAIFVIARHSTFTYKGKPVKVQQVSRELGVKYVLEGSVQRAGDRLRVTAQLIDATTGNHLWSERYDRDLKDIFALQDEITLKILAALQVKLIHGEQAQMWAKGTENLDAYLKLMQAREYYLQMNMESAALARQMAKEAIALDPEYGDAYSWLGATHMLDVFLGSSKAPKESIEKAIQLTKKALALDDSLAVARSRLGFLYTLIGQHEKGVAEAERGVALNSNSAGAHDYLGFALRFAGRPEEAIPIIKKAIRLNPFPPAAAFYNLGMAYLYTGQCEEAIAACEKALQGAKDNLLATITATAAYSMCGRQEEAQVTAANLLSINPKFSCRYFAKRLPYKNQADLDKYIEALRRAGLPD